MFFTWIDIVKKSGLKIPVSTSANYRDAFINYFRYEQNGRNKKYHISSIDVLIDIVNGYKQKNTPEEIREILESKYGTSVEIVQQNSDVPATTQQTEFLEVFTGLQQQYTDLKNEIKELRVENKAFNQRHDEILMEHIRLHQQQNQQANKTFFQKISELFGKNK